MIFYPEGKVFDPSSFDWGWVDVISDMIAYASPEIREEIKREVQERLHRTEGAKIIFGHCDESYAADLGDKRKGWGKVLLS